MNLKTSLFVLFIFILGFIGWVWNIFKIFASISEPITAEFIARLVGVFAVPLGSIIGYF